MINENKPIKTENITDISLPINETIFDKLTENTQNLPEIVKQEFKEIAEIIKNDLNVPQLYGEILAEIPFSTSLYQDICVQMESHFTPHRKLRQVMLELDNRLRALYAAKDGYANSYFKYQRLQAKIEKLQEELNDPNLSPADKKIKEIKIMEYQYDLQKAKRELESSTHLIKDAMLKVAMYKQLAEKYKKEVEESGLSFEESEVIYYVMYFAKDIESQLRTMGRIDTGTMGAIAQLPEAMRKRVLWVANFIAEKLQNGEGKDEYIHIKYRDEIIPKKTGENEFDGFKLTEFINLEPIKLLALPGETNNNE